MRLPKYTSASPPHIRLVPSPLPPPPSPRNRRPFSLSFRITPHLASDLATDNAQIAQSRQHNNRAPPRGWRIGPKHHLCSTPPIEPLFGTTASLERITLIRFSGSFVRFTLSFFLRPRARRSTLKTIHLFTCKSGYLTSPCGSVAHHQDRFFLPSFYPHFYSLVRSVLVPNRVSQPYKYPCARLAKQQATVAQVLALLSFMCWALAAHFFSFVSEVLSRIRHLTLRRLSATVSGWRTLTRRLLPDLLYGALSDSRERGLDSTLSFPSPYLLGTHARSLRQPYTSLDQRLERINKRPQDRKFLPGPPLNPQLAI